MYPIIILILSLVLLFAYKYARAFLLSDSGSKKHKLLFQVALPGTVLFLVQAGLAYSISNMAGGGSSVRNYLLENPEVIIEAGEALQRKEMAQALEKVGDDLTTTTLSPVEGNPNGDVTIVEFFDYNCGHCKRSNAEIEKIISQDKNVRVILRNKPIFGEKSILPATASIAAQKQGKGVELHKAMIEEPDLSMDNIMKMAANLGLDVEKLKTDMKASDVQEEINKSIQIAETLGIRGTPGFVIGDQIIPGALPADAMLNIVKEVRSRQ